MSTDTSYKTKNDVVKWKQKIPSQCSHSLVFNIVDADKCWTNTTQLVPQGLQSPLDGFKLTLPVNCMEILLFYTNHKFNQYCHQYPNGFVVNHFRGYHPFSKEVLPFMDLSFLSGAHKCNQQRISDLYDSKFLLHFKAAISWLLLLIRFSRFDAAETRDKCKMTSLVTFVKFKTLQRPLHRTLWNRSPC